MLRFRKYGSLDSETESLRSCRSPSTSSHDVRVTDEDSLDDSSVDEENPMRKLGERRRRSKRKRGKLQTSRKESNGPSQDEESKRQWRRIAPTARRYRLPVLGTSFVLWVYLIYIKKLLVPPSVVQRMTEKWAEGKTRNRPRATKQLQHDDTMEGLKGLLKLEKLSSENDLAEGVWQDLAERVWPEGTKAPAFNVKKNLPTNNSFQVTKTPNESTRHTNGTTKPLKYILYVNDYWSFHDYQFGEGQQPFIDNDCPETACFATADESLVPFDQYDALLVHMHNPFDDYELSQKRAFHQRVILMSMESPYSAGFPYLRPHFWNWTMTYRKDSDLVRPYGFFANRSDDTRRYFPEQLAYQTFRDYDEQEFVQEILPTLPREITDLAKRQHMVGWISSRDGCSSDSDREVYIEELQKYITIDTMGKCGTHSCDMTWAGTIGIDNCTEAVEKHYKFYLSMENSRCDDYVTEKFFHRMRHNVLPIVYGGANYLKFAPPHSYLNIQDFESPKALADYLHVLANNETLYLSYFWWHKYYTVHSKTNHATTMCQLCEKLHANEPPKVYEDMDQWLIGDAHCTRGLDSKLLGQRGRVGVQQVSFRDW